MESIAPSWQRCGQSVVSQIPIRNLPQLPCVAIAFQYADLQVTSADGSLSHLKFITANVKRRRRRGTISSGNKQRDDVVLTHFHNLRTTCTPSSCAFTD